MAKKPMFENIVDVHSVTHENIVDKILENYDILAMDDDAFQINQATGELNPRYQMNDKYGVGGVLDSLAYHLNSKTAYIKDLQDACIKEKELNGAESITLQKMSERKERAIAEKQFYDYLFTMFCDMFERLTTIAWGQGQAAPQDDPYHRGWWSAYKDTMSERRVLSKTSDEDKRARLFRKSA